MISLLLCLNRLFKLELFDLSQNSLCLTNCDFDCQRTLVTPQFDPLMNQIEMTNLRMLIHNLLKCKTDPHEPKPFKVSKDRRFRNPKCMQRYPWLGPCNQDFLNISKLQRRLKILESLWIIATWVVLVVQLGNIYGLIKFGLIKRGAS